MLKILSKNKYICVAIYIVMFKYIWTNYCVYWFSYMGFTYNGANFSECLWAYLLAVIPISLYRGIKKTSSFLSVILYLLAYVPIIIALRISVEIPETIKLQYELILFVAMSLFFIADRIKVREWRPSILQVSSKCVLILTGILFLYLLIVFRNNLTLSGFGSELYELRSENDDVILSGYNGYILLWVQKAFLPFLFVIYFKRKDSVSRVITASILFSYILLFMMSAQKITILTPFLILGMSYLLKNKDSLLYSLSIGLSIISIIVLMAVETPIGFAIGAILFVRTICICPLLFVMYTKFFITNPYTYYSHINIVNAITHMYPYDDMLGKVVSEDVENNANAFFWTTDGIAACGALGLVIISFIFFVFLLFINKLPSLNISRKYIMLMFVPTLTSLLNCSLFTYFVSHGIFILILLILFVRMPSVLKE